MTDPVSGSNQTPTSRSRVKRRGRKTGVGMQPHKRTGIDIAGEPEVSVWDLAALDILVRESGGTFTGLDGTAGPHRGSAVATNGLLHEQVLGRIGDETV